MRVQNKELYISCNGVCILNPIHSGYIHVTLRENLLYAYTNVKCADHGILKKVKVKQ